MTIQQDAAAGTPASPAVHRSGLVVWLPLVIAALLVLSMLRQAARPISDPDAWWHLRVGSLFWSGEFSVFRTGPLSSFATEPWTPRDWLPQLVASLAESRFGLPGVAWLYGASLVTFVVLTFLVSRRQADPLPAVLATALCLAGAAGSLSQRPQMVSFILLLLVVDAWLRTATDLRPRWWLVPLTWAWASSHGMWYLGVAVGGAVVVGLLLDRRVGVRRASALSLVPLLSLVAAAVTPAGPSLLLSVVQTGDKWRFVTEWAPPDFTSMRPAAAMLMAVLVATIWARMRTPLSWTHTLVLLLATAMVLMAARTVAAGAAMLVPLLAMSLQQALYRRAPLTVERREGLTLGGAASVTLLALALVVPHTSATPGAVPNALNEELDALAPGSPILNAYELGGWLHWRHPDLNTVIDGFTDGYSIDSLEEYASAVAVAPGWEEYVDATDAEHALLPEESPLTVALVDRLGWMTVGSDEGYVLLEDPRS